MISPAEEHFAAFAHVRNSFDLTVHLPYGEAALLFGPNGERGWSDGHWDPQFFYPLPGKDIQGAVFSSEHGSTKSTWVNTAFDLDARHFQYVYFVPDVLVTTIDLHFVIADRKTTKVTVTYERTALTATANDHVRALGDKDRRSGKEWELAIEKYLRSRLH